jgi:hypothetical protein
LFQPVPASLTEEKKPCSFPPSCVSPVSGAESLKGARYALFAAVNGKGSFFPGFFSAGKIPR